jgi:glycosyltransferase involved in cell wall biosynthesis
MMRISVIILTLNEELNLEGALDSVCGWASDVFVVDSFSADRTVDIALSRPASDRVQTVQHRFESYSAQWNWALDALPIQTEWVLKLDADERVSVEFKDECARIATERCVAYAFRRRLYFLGTPLLWGLTRNNWDVRLWKNAYARFDDRGCNEHLVVCGGPVGKMRAYVEHHDSKDISAWFAKQNRYASWEARVRIRGEGMGAIARLFGTRQERINWLRRAYFRIPLHNLLLFFYSSVVRGGILDGTTGVHYAVLQSVIRYLSDIKVAEFRRTGRMPSIEATLPGAPHQAVATSSLQAFVDTRTEPNALARGVSFPWRRELQSMNYGSIGVTSADASMS